MVEYIKTALVSDFDGTISDDDFFNYVCHQYLGQEALIPWQEYLQGKKTHFEALKEIFSSLRVNQKEFDEFICQIPIDEYFFKTAAFCRQKEIPVYICSAGCDYYIQKRLGDKIKNLNLKLITNHGVYNSQTGLIITPLPLNSPFYDPDTGVNKASIVHYLQLQGYKVVYCGDGKPDIPAAIQANIVFARKTLLSQCKQLKIPIMQLENFNQVYHFLKGE